MAPPVTDARWRTWLIIGHIAVSVAMIGAAGVLVALGISGLRGGDPRTIYPAAHLIDAWVVVPLALAAVSTGTALALLTRRAVLMRSWVTIKLVITVITAAVVLFVLEPRLAASARAAVAGEAFATTDFVPLAVAPAIAIVLLVVNVALGVTKPGERTTRRARDAHTDARP